MKKGLKLMFFFIVLGVMVLSTHPVKAQCAQCSATVSSSSKNGDKTTNGLNAGILFLLAMPYLVVAAAGTIWYKKYRRKNVNIDIRDEKLHLN